MSVKEREGEIKGKRRRDGNIIEVVCLKTIPISQECNRVLIIVNVNSKYHGGGDVVI